MNIIDAVNKIKFKLEPKIENAGKYKPIFPDINDLLAINTIMEFVEKTLLDNEMNKDIRIQKLYLILFIIYLKEYECPISAEKMIYEKYKLPLSFYLEKIKSLLETFYIENSKDLYKDLPKMELETEEIIKSIKIFMNNLFTFQNV